MLFLTFEGILWFCALLLSVNIIFIAGFIFETRKVAQQKVESKGWWFGLSNMFYSRPTSSKPPLLKGAAGGDYGVRQLHPGETEYENAKEQFLVGAISLRPQPRIMKIYAVQTNEDVSRCK